MKKYKNEEVLYKTDDGNTVSVFRPSLFCLILHNSGNLKLCGSSVR